MARGECEKTEEEVDPFKKAFLEVSVPTLEAAERAGRALMHVAELVMAS